MKIWQTAKRKITFDKTLVMAILNITPDSFSDGGKFFSIDEALRQTEKYVAEGADILDIGGESTRPKAKQISAVEEIRRVVPIIEEISKRFDVPISIDTSKSEVAAKAIEAGAEIINDVSGLTFDAQIADVAFRFHTGLILMHLRGNFETMHTQKRVEDIVDEVCKFFGKTIETAKSFKVEESQIMLDVGIGFSKTFEQNLELLAKLDKIIAEFPQYPMIIGASRKSFIGIILGDLPVTERLNGSLASAAVAAWNGADLLRVHDVRETVEALKIVDAVKREL